MKEKRRYGQVSSVWKFRNLLVFIIIVLLIGIFFSTILVTGKTSKVHNTKAIEAMEKNVFVEKITKTNKDINIEADITTVQHGIVLGRPVRWKKNIKLSEPTNLSVELPSTATNISIVKLVIGNATLNETEVNETIPANITEVNKTNITIPEDVSKRDKEEDKIKKQKPEIKEEINKSKKKPEIEEETKNKSEEKTEIEEDTINKSEEKTEIEEAKNKSLGKPETEKVINESKKKPEIEEETKNKSEEEPEIEKEKPINKSGKIKKKEIIIDITGNIILKDISDKTLVSQIVEWFRNILRLTGLFLIEDSGEENIVVEIDEIVKEVEIEYETPAPYSIEKEQENKKLITIVGPENLHYENILAFTELPKEVLESAVRLYHIVNGTRVEIEFRGYNLNEQELNQSNQNYVNISEKNKESKNVTRMVMNLPPEINNYNDNNYLNVSEEKNKRAQTEPNQCDQLTSFPTQDVNCNNQNYLNVSEEKNKGAKNVTPRLKDLLPEYNNYNDNKYINVDEKNIEGKKSLNLVEHPSLRINNPNTNNYLNVSANDNNVEDALVAQFGRAPVSKTGVLQDIRVRNSVLSESLGQGVSTTDVQNSTDKLINYIEWVVPYLSNQSYELIIEISKAEHLDENRTFISDIYEEVKALDGNWSEPIYNNEYVRVTFEQALDNTRDITIYARSNGSAEIEVYAGCDSYVIINGIEVPYDVYLKKKRIEEIRRLLE